MNEVSRKELASWLDQTLQPQRFRDYCPNGLQVEGAATIRHIIAGVTASEALLRVAIDRGADTVLVHHGWFWKNEDPTVRGTRRARLALALGHDLNVFGFHLPLDAHPELGNNAQLARVLGLQPDRDEEGGPLTCGPSDLVWLGRCAAPLSLEALGRQVATALGREPLVVGDQNAMVQRLAWCTGGAQGMMQSALDAGAQVYITGEASEPNYHLALETGAGFIAAGHHATERYGVQALGEAIRARFGLRVDFIDLDNPI